MLFFAIFTPMKNARHIITALLSVYLLVLMVMPCSDAHTQMGGNTTTHFSKADSHHDHTDLCTPFCVCSGCIAAIVLQPALEFSLLNFDVSAKEPVNFYESVASSFYGSIWQPPQIV